MSIMSENADRTRAEYGKADSRRSGIEGVLRTLRD
jgi:hypothetical protein